MPSTQNGTMAQQVLKLAREHLGMEVAWLSEFADGQQSFTHVDAAADAGSRAGSSPLAGSYCVRVLDGRLPAVVNDALAHPLTRDLPVTRELGIGSYVGVPVTAADGQVRGMLCCTSATASPDVDERDVAVLQMLADMLGRLTASQSRREREQTVVRDRVAAAVAGNGLRVVLQPIVDVRTGRAIAMEALSRFARPPHRPDLWFAQAHGVGLGQELELAAASLAVRTLDRIDPQSAVSVNLSPEVITTSAFNDLLAGADRSRVIVEVTEHAPVGDYAALQQALAPHRAAGLRLAVDDAGAGYASFRHIVQLNPDIIKIDLSLVRDVDVDPVRQALVGSLLAFGRKCGTRLVAEGIESQSELDTLARLGVTLGQGYLFSRPVDDPPANGYPGPSPHVLLDQADDIACVLARAVADSTTLADLAGPLLELVLRVTGLQSSYLTSVDEASNTLQVLHARNAGALQVPEGLTVPWDGTPCAAARRRQLSWTSSAPTDLSECVLVGELGLRTYLTVPVHDAHGTLIGTLCGASTTPTHITDDALSQTQLFTRLLAARMPQHTVVR